MLEALADDAAAPGETLHPGIEPLFRTLGLGGELAAMDFHRHAGVWREWDAGIDFMPYGGDAAGPWLGFQAERSRLHALLRSTAVDLGARLLRPCAARKPLLDRGRVIGVAGGDQVYLARWTLDATGRRAWLAQALGLRPRWCSPPLDLRFGWREVRASDHADPVIRARPLGWDWQAPIGSHRLAWVALRIPESPAAQMRRSHFAWRIHDAAAGPGYFLLGDAAAWLDPMSAHGVLHAMMCAMLAIHLVAACREGQLAEQLAAADHRAWCRDRFEQDAAVLRALYARHPTGLCLARRFARSPTPAAGRYPSAAPSAAYPADC